MNSNISDHLSYASPFLRICCVISYRYKTIRNIINEGDERITDAQKNCRNFCPHHVSLLLEQKFDEHAQIRPAPAGSSMYLDIL